MWPVAAMMFGGGSGRGWGRSRGGDWGGEFGGRGGPRGPRGRNRVFGSGELRLALLHLLEQAPRHGYDLIKAIEEQTGGAYAPSPGVVYPTLSLLTDEGLIEEQAGDGARKVFALTKAGHMELTERAEAAADGTGRSG